VLAWLEPGYDDHRLAGLLARFARLGVKAVSIRSRADNTRFRQVTYYLRVPFTGILTARESP